MKKYLILGICLLLGISNVSGQVTMGSHEAPVKGALLDLKDGTATGNATATKGLLLPRVKLSDKKNLFPMFEADGANYKIGTTTYTKADEDAKHLGLIVYHMDKCALEGTGLYVWNLDGWKKINEGGEAGGINFNNDYFDLPSGHDARPLEPQNLTIGWNVAGNLAYTKSDKFGGGVPFAGANALPGSPLTVNPTSIDLLPTKMTIADPEQPWQSKETQLSFTDTECGNITRTVTLNQTNYELKVNGVFGYSQIYFNTPISGTFDVEGNVSYKVKKIDENNVLKTLTPSIDGILDKTINDYPAITAKLNKTTFNFETNAGSKHDICYLIFSDDKQPRRFVDISVAILNCDYNTDDGTLEDWVKDAGFTDADIAATPTGGTFKIGGVPVTKPNGVQMHKDQDGNLFLSGNFGYEDAAKTKERRWMLNNLSATTYAKPHALGLIPVKDPKNKKDAAYIIPEYPKTTLANSKTPYYDNNQKIGMSYSFDCATGGHKTRPYVNDYEHSGTPISTRIQGICPNGWYLPSDADWTQLQFEIDQNLSTYSGLEGGHDFKGYNPNLPHEILKRQDLPYTRAFVQACGLKTTQDRFKSSQGASNYVNDPTKKPGMNVLLALVNAIQPGHSNTYTGASAAFMTSATQGQQRCIIVYLTVEPGFYERENLHMVHDWTYVFDPGHTNNPGFVRCKKNN